MKNKNTLALLFTLLLFISSCADFDELRVNPNEPTSVAPSLIFTNFLPVASSPFSGTYMTTQHHHSIGGDSGPILYVNYRGYFYHKDIQSLEFMVKEAEKIGARGYAPLAKFLKVHTYFEMVRRMGDLPLSEALRLDEGIIYPVYDSQKSIFIQLLKWLDEANSEIAPLVKEGLTVTGDFYYDGDLSKWQRVINSYSLRILIELSKKANDSELNIKGKFANIVNNPDKYPLFRGNEDDMKYEHWDEDGFRFGLNPDSPSAVDRTVVGGLYVNLLKANKDPRLFMVADPTPAALAADPKAASNFDAYAGPNVSTDLAELQSAKNAGLFSRVKNSRYINYVGIPNVFLSYVEQEFTLAEAANRGWIPNAKMHYDKAVTASMEFNGVAPKDISTFLNGLGAYIGDNIGGLEQILNQKYIGFFQNSDMESFFNQRRTGVPEFAVSSENTPRQKIPVRWMYPTVERDTDNPVNYREALVRQFGSEIDDVDNVLWHMK